MLIPFLIEGRSLSEGPDNYYDKSDYYAFHDRVLEFWRDFGALAYGKSASPKDLYRNFEDVSPPGLRIKYLALLAHGARYLTDLKDTQVQVPLSKDIPAIDVALLSNSIANNYYQFSDDTEAREKVLTDEKSGRRITLCKGAHFRNTARFESWIKTASSLISPSNQPTDMKKLWVECFHTLFAAELTQKGITIVDRYAFSEELHDGGNAIFDAGTMRLLKEIDRSSTQQRSVTIFLSNTVLNGKKGERPLPRSRLVDLVAEARKNCRAGRITKIEVIMSRDITFNRHAHDRHIRVGDRYVWDLGKGAEVFSVRPRTNNVSKSFKTDSEVVRQYKEKEKILTDDKVDSIVV